MDSFRRIEKIIGLIMATRIYLVLNVEPGGKIKKQISTLFIHFYILLVSHYLKETI